MLCSEEAARANVRNREGRRVFYLGKGYQLTSAFRDREGRPGRVDILRAWNPRSSMPYILMARWKNGNFPPDKG